MKTRTSLKTRNLPFLILLLVILISCGKKPDTIGLDLVDDNKPIVGTDTTLEVIAYSVLEDSVRSDETSSNVIGSMQSPTFGLTNASLFTHLRISDPYPIWGPNPVADSIFLYMVYDTAYGNLSTEQTFSIFRVTQDFALEDTIYSNTNLTYDESQIYAQHSFYPDLTKILVVDSTEDGVDSSYLAALLRIPIDFSFADYIFNLDTSFMRDNETFIDEFKGIYIRPNDVNGAGEGALLSFNLLSERSYLQIYYQNDTTDSLSYSFLINGNCARAAKYEHNYLMSQDPTFINQVVNKDTTLGSQSLYLQGLGGVKTMFTVPGLEEWAGTGRKIINEAKLIFESNEYTEELSPPTLVYLYKFNDENVITTLLDQNKGDNFFGGRFNSTSKSYWFRMSLEAQKILNGEPNFGFVLFPSVKSIRPNELVMPGTNPNIPGRFKLSIIYTETE